MPSSAVEDYLKAIYKLQRRHEKVTTSLLADRLEVSPASVTGMVKKMSRMNLVGYRKYEGVELTDAGRKIALEVIRHHRLVEAYLHEALEVPWDKVHEEAEKWEHILSEYLEDRIDSVLGHPKTDPHGAPIPKRDGTVENREYVSLADLKPGQRGVVAEVSDADPDMLRYLANHSLYPGSTVWVEQVSDSDDTMTIRTGRLSQEIDPDAAEQVFLVNVEPAPSDHPG